jgi:glycosyltransferase involved in cell wall biosynthesis
MIVGFPGYIIVPFAKLISKKPVIFDALCSFYETQIVSRDAYRGNIFRIPYVRMVDWLATRCADLILVESESQKKYFIESLGVKERKIEVLYTGVNDETFHLDYSVKKLERFTVLFRGRITNEAGATIVIEAAKLLEDQDVDFLIIGYGFGRPIDEFLAIMNRLQPKNVRFINKHLPIDQLRTQMLQCHVSLGQFADNERLKRTIPHKAFESLAMRLPYITSRVEGHKEFLVNEKNCLLVGLANPRDLADKILRLKQDPVLMDKLAREGYELYKQSASPRVLGKRLVEICGVLIGARTI